MDNATLISKWEYLDEEGFTEQYYDWSEALFIELKSRRLYPDAVQRKRLHRYEIREDADMYAFWIYPTYGEHEGYVNFSPDPDRYDLHWISREKVEAHKHWLQTSLFPDDTFEFIEVTLTEEA